MSLLDKKVNTGEKTAFNEVEISPSTPYVEGSATYNLIPNNFREFTSGTGTTGTEDRKFKVTTGTGSGGYGAIQSFRSLSHRVGKGVTCRFSGYFTTNVANSWQGIGMISVGDEVSFGYNGTDFGIWHRYNGLPEVRTIQVTGASGGSSNLTLTLNSVAYTIPLTTGSVQHNAYQIAAWLNNTSNQSVWTADQLDDSVIISALSDGAKSGTYSFSHGSATGTITQNTAGATKTSDFVSESDWNGETLSRSLDPSKGNLYQISYQDMGFGSIKYYIMDEISENFKNVHTIRYPNSYTTLSLPNPALRTGMYCVSLGSTTNLSVYAHSFGSYVEGIANKTRNPRAFSANQTITSTDETAILTLRNRKTYNYLNNQVDIQPLIVTVSNETARSAIVRVRATSNVGIEQNFQTTGTNLVGDVDITAINFTGGTLLASRSLPPTNSVTIDLKNLEVSQPPSLNLVVTVERVATGGSNQNFTGTITWYEDI